MKRWATLLLLICLLAAGSPEAASAGTQEAGASVTVSIEQILLESDVEPQLIGSTTYVPMRAFCQSMADSALTWDGENRLAIAQSDFVTVEAGAGRRYITINGRCFFVPQGVRIIAGRMMLPVRLLAGAYGAKVSWEQATKTVTVSATGAPLPSGENVYSGEELYWLSRIICAESQGETIEGKLAVGNVVLNRVASKKYPDSVYEAVFDTNYGVQFTPVATGTIYEAPDAESVVAAKLALEGYNVAGNSLYFFNRQKSRGDWIVSHCSYVAVIGSHTFYV